VTDASRSEYLKVDGYRIYVRSFGRGGGRPPLLCVHGGPGSTHDYLLPHTDLVRRGFRVVFYDALGCGRSDLPDGSELYTHEHDLSVLDAVIDALGARRVHLMGSSYGGMLALHYAARHSDRLASLVSVGGLCDVPFTTREMQRLVCELPARTQAVLRRYARLGQYTHPRYEEAMMGFYRRHICRLRPWPEGVTSALSKMSRPVYQTMNGPNEFTIVGNIRDIDFTRELPRIDVPSLVIHGRYDEVTPAVGARIHAGIPGSRMRIFPRSSHLSFWEERPEYMRLVGDFLRDAAP
jgi:proline-specific peptidase